MAMHWCVDTIQADLVLLPVLVRQRNRVSIRYTYHPTL